MRQRHRPFRVRIVAPGHYGRARCLNLFLCGVFGPGLLEVTYANLEKALAQDVPFRNIFNHRDKGIWWLSEAELKEAREKHLAWKPSHHASFSQWQEYLQRTNRVAGELLLEGLARRGYPV